MSERQDPGQCEVCRSPGEMLEEGDGFICFRCPQCSETWTYYFTPERQAEDEQNERFHRALSEADDYNRKHGYGAYSPENLRRLDEYHRARGLGPYAKNGRQSPEEPPEEEPWAEEPPEEEPWSEEPSEELEEDEEPWREHETEPDEEPVATTTDDTPEEPVGQEPAEEAEEPAPAFEVEEFWRQDSGAPVPEEPAEESPEEWGGSYGASGYGGAFGG